MVRLVTNLLGLIFPIQCIGCGKTGTYLCAVCENRIYFEPWQKCAMCNKNSIGGETHMRCKKFYGIDGVWAMAANQGIIRKLIHKYKYSYVEDLNQLLVGMLVKRMPDGLRKFELIVPVPLFEMRKRLRGYNQAEKLGKLLGKKLRILFNDDLLERIKATGPQALIRERKKRLKNLKNAFKIKGEVNRELIKGKSILLVDDVATTGTTLRRAAILLKRGGARKVWGVVIAR